MSGMRKAGESRETILIIDDEEMVRMALAEGLGRSGYRVLEARDAESGLAAFKAYIEQIDLIILDLVLPEQWGDEIFPQLRLLKADIKVMVYSGYSVQENEFEGVNAVITKPVPIDRLIGKVQMLLAAPE